MAQGTDVADGAEASRAAARRLTDEQVEQVIGNLLRAGVFLAALVVVIGGAFYLKRHGMEHPSYRVFTGEPESLRHVGGVVDWAVACRSRGIIQLGLLLLIATPIARVGLSLFAFTLQRDRLYVLLTAFVLAVLLYSLLGGGSL